MQLNSFKRPMCVVALRTMPTAIAAAIEVFDNGPGASGQLRFATLASQLVDGLAHMTRQRRLHEHMMQLQLLCVALLHARISTMHFNPVTSKLALVLSLKMHVGIVDLKYPKYPCSKQLTRVQSNPPSIF